MKTTYKLIFTLSLAFAAAFAFEKSVYNDDFLYIQSEVEIKIYKDKAEQIKEKAVADNRNVASAERELPNIDYIRFNEENKKKINGKWKVTRIIDHEKNVLFDVRNNEEDQDKDLFLDFELKGSSLLYATFTEGEAKESFYFDISRVSDGGTTIILFRAYKNGYEIFEAEKLIKEKTRVGTPRKNQFAMRYPTPKNTDINQPARNVVKGARFLKLEHIGANLVLERAMYPSRAQGLLQDEMIEGSVSFGDDSIEYLEATLLRGTPNEVTIRVDPSEINKVGHFHFYEENQNGDMVKASGLVTNNGEGGYRLRFVNGKHSGAMLSFVTQRELDLMREKAEEMALEKEYSNVEANDDAEVEDENERTPQSVGKPKGFSFSNKAEQY